jgi:hypothetical protein
MLQVQGCFYVVKDMTKPFTSLFDASMFWYVLHKGIKVQPNFALRHKEYNPSICIFASRYMSTTLQSILLP